MRIYVAGASAELWRAQRIIASLKEAGHTITFDWTRSVEEYGALPASASLRDEAAEADTIGVADAELVVFLHPAQGVTTTGMWFEFGYLRGLNDGSFGEERRLLLSFEHAESRQQPPVCIFTALVPLENQVLDEELLELIGGKWRISDILEALLPELDEFYVGSAKYVMSWLRSEGYHTAKRVLRYHWKNTLPRVLGEHPVRNDEDMERVAKVLVAHAIRLKVKKRGR